jgi:rod shape-determining protein MreD
MKKYIVVLLVIGFALSEATVLNAIALFGVKPNLLLCCVFIVSALSEQPGLSLAVSVMSGLLKDVFTVNASAVNTVLLPLWGIMTFLLSRKISFEHRMFRAIALAVIIVLHNAALRLLLFSQDTFVGWGIVVRNSLGEALYTIALLPLLHAIIIPFLGRAGTTDKNFEPDREELQL